MPETWSDGQPVDYGERSRPVVLTDEHGKKYEIDVEKHTFKAVKTSGGSCGVLCCLMVIVIVVMILLAGGVC